MPTPRIKCSAAAFSAASFFISYRWLPAGIFLAVAATLRRPCVPPASSRLFPSPLQRSNVQTFQPSNGRAATHGLLDAMTNGGLGVAFLSPFDNSRYFLPWRPILVSPIGVARFFSERGLAVLQSELVWIWLPAALFAALMWFYRRRTNTA